SAGIAGPYQILADGAPLEPSHPDGYTTSDVAAFDPSSPAAEVGLHAVDDGALVAMTDSGPVPVPGPLGSSKVLIDASLARDGRHVAAVQKAPAPSAGGELVVGEYGAATDVAATGPWMTEPTWSTDASVWESVGGDTVQRVAPGSDAEPTTTQAA